MKALTKKSGSLRKRKKAMCIELKSKKAKLKIQLRHREIRND